MNEIAFRKIDRCRFSFRSRNVLIETTEGTRETFPCIVLVDDYTNDLVCCTGLERYVINLNEHTNRLHSGTKTGAYREKKTTAVADYLTFLLHHTRANGVHESTLDDIRNYLIHIKTKSNGDECKEDTWSRKKIFVLKFLVNYYTYNSEKLIFSYKPTDLIQEDVLRIKGSRLKIIDTSIATLGVKPPNKSKHKKNRILLHDYLQILMYEAKKWNPELELAIALSAYGGLREGSVVNMTCGSYKETLVSLNSDRIISLDLTKPAAFFTSWRKKTDPGKIKKPREQLIYDDFVEKVTKIHKDHIIRHEANGIPTDHDSPLFVNKYGNALTVSAYQNQLKNLFYQNFLPKLETICETEGNWAVHAAYIDSYKEEYPGGHMLRHWFTMYLVTRAKRNGKPLPISEIAKYRGDESEESMNNYLHENEVLIAAYREAQLELHRSLIEY